LWGRKHLGHLQWWPLRVSHCYMAAATAFQATDRQTDRPRHSVKPPLLQSGALQIKLMHKICEYRLKLCNLFNKLVKTCWGRGFKPLSISKTFTIRFPTNVQLGDKNSITSTLKRFCCKYFLQLHKFRLFFRVFPAFLHIP